MKLFKNDKVIIRIAGDHLQYGDIAIIKKVDLNSDVPYFCFCALRDVGEWFPERQLDKVKEKQSPKTSSIVRRKEPIDVKFIERQKGVYNNIPVYKYDK